MNLKAVSDKLKKTKLFSDAQKVELFSLLPGASQEDLAKLESGIDAFDEQYRVSMEKNAERIRGAIAGLFADMPEEEKARYQDELDEIGMGLALLTTASN